MRLAFLGHSHHRTTRSSAFFLELLRGTGEVEEIWDEGWLTGAELDLEPVISGSFDAIVVWQLETVALRLARAGLQNVTYFPMYDSCHSRLDRYWRALAGIKVVCFSSTLHERLQQLGVRSRFVRYFPDPDRLGRASPEPGLAGYFWERHHDLGWSTIRPLLGDATFRQFTLHRAPDPDVAELPAPSPEDVRRWRIRNTGWFATREQAAADLATHNVYFAPRLREGIGMGFLEAMGMGFLVVAADRPTMNEYVLSGVNGLLYDPADPRSLDLSRYAELGARARRTVELGWRAWRRCIPALLEFVRTPAAEQPVLAPFDAFDPAATSAARGGAMAGRRRWGRRARGGVALEGGRRRSPPQGCDPAAPLVTVAVVARDAVRLLPATLDSVLQQDWPNVELIVLDDASRDGTVDLLRQREGELDRWRSAPQRGDFEAMNAAVQGASGRWVICLRAGDTLHARDALSLALDGTPDDTDVVVGHRVLRHAAGHEELRRAPDPAEVFALLRRGEADWDRLSRLPEHPATLVRTELLRREPFRPDLRVAADHELLLRLAAKGARFHRAASVLTTTPARSWREAPRRLEEWRRIAAEHSERPMELPRAFAEIRAQARRAELDCLPAWGLALRLLQDRRALAALADRVRSARARRRARRPRR